MADYTIKVSKNQMRIIMVALESFFRVRMGQHFDLADEIAGRNYNYDETDPNNDKKFRDYINRRNDAQDAYDKAFMIATGNKLIYKTDDMRDAIDIWHVIRHQFWLDNPKRLKHVVDADEPFQTGTEPLCEVERINDG